MKQIMVLNGAARKNGNTAALLKAFTEGAESAGNVILGTGKTQEAYDLGKNI